MPTLGFRKRNVRIRYVGGHLNVARIMRETSAGRVSKVLWVF